jgi:hypothetical protein
MRIIDLLRPFEEGLERIADETPATIDIRRHIFASDKVAYERSAPGSTDRVPRGTIVITVLGPDRQQHGDPAAAASVIARLDLGARAIVLFGWNPGDLPYHRILDALTEHRCQVLHAAALDLGTIGSAAVIEHVDELKPPRNALGELIITAPNDDVDPLAMQLRMANEYVFGEFDRRTLRSTLNDASRGVDQRRFNAYRAETEGQLKERDARIRDLLTKVAYFERSTSLKVGRALVGAAKSPRALARLPLSLFRIWRARRS